MPAVAADHDQIRFYLVSKGMDFRFRATEDEVLVSWRDVKRLSKFFEMCPGRFLYLLLDSGQIHWNVATVSEAQGFDDVSTAQFSSASSSQRTGTLRYMP